MDTPSRSPSSSGSIGRKTTIPTQGKSQKGKERETVMEIPQAVQGKGKQRRDHAKKKLATAWTGKKYNPDTHFVADTGRILKRTDITKPPSSESSSSEFGSEFNPEEKKISLGRVNTPRPIEKLPVPQRDDSEHPISVTAKRLQEAFDNEKTYWSTKFAKDEVFQDKVTDFLNSRDQLIEEIGRGAHSKEVLEHKINQLGSKLALLFDAAEYNFEKGEVVWTKQTIDNSKKAGEAYAQPSKSANWLTSAVGIGKSTAFLAYTLASLGLLYTSVATGENPSATNTTIPELNATLPEAMSNSTELFDVTPGFQWMQAATYLSYSILQFAALPLVTALNAKWQSAAVARQTVDVGPQPPVKSDKLKKEDGSDGKLRAVKDIEQAIVDVQARISELEDVEVIEIAQSGGDDQVEDAQFDEDPKAKLTEFKNELTALRKELVIAGLYPQLNVLPEQSINRIRRIFANDAASVAGFLTSLGGLTVNTVTNSLIFAAVTEFLQVSTQIAQPYIYSLNHGKDAGSDQLKKLAKTYQIAALTGHTNLWADDGTIDPRKLDAAMKGPLKTVLDHLGGASGILEFDRKVYEQAMFANFVDAKEKITIHGQGAIEATFANMVTEFRKQKTPQTRFECLERFMNELECTGDIKTKVRETLRLYEANELSIAAAVDGDIEKLLGDKSPLTPDTKTMLQGALSAVQNPENKADLEQLNKLCKLKGQTESQTDTGSIPQTAQKAGQTASYILCGSAGQFVIKAVAGLTDAFVSMPVFNLTLAERQKIIHAIGMGAGGLSLLASVVALTGAISYQNNIAEKALQRQEITTKGIQGIAHAGVLHDTAFPVFNFDRMRSKVSVFDTLAAEPINKALLPTDPLKYVTEMRNLRSSSWSQMFTYNPLSVIKDVWQNGFPKGGSLELDPQDPEYPKKLQAHLDKVKESAEKELKKFADTYDGEAIESSFETDEENEYATYLKRMGITDIDV
jgi:hypothetical protein